MLSLRSKEGGSPTERLGYDKPGQPSPDFPMHRKMRDIPDGALKQKPKVQIKKDSLIGPQGADFLGRIPRASYSRLGEQQGRHPPTSTQDPCRQGYHVQRSTQPVRRCQALSPPQVFNHSHLVPGRNQMARVGLRLPKKARSEKWAVGGEMAWR